MLTLLKSINDATTFEEVVEIRQDGYRENMRNDNHFEDILVGLYKEDTHFLYELLQNADDVEATSIELTLTKRELIFWHDGVKDFDLRDVIAITGIGSGTKRDEPNKIGKFGIGFKSVFSITESPRIFSGEFDFEIRHFSVPARLERGEFCREHGTTIVLPFNHREKNQEEIYADIEKALNHLDANVFMFLNNIECVNWTSETINKSLLKEVKDIDGCNEMSIVTNTDNKLNQYLVFSEPLSTNPKLNISIAYKVTEIDSVRRIAPLPNSKLSVYFFTETVTYLNFIVNGPFQTSSTRESVDGNKPHNQGVLEEIASLYRKSLKVLKEKKFIDESFLSILPIIETNRRSSFVYDRLYQETIKIIKSECILPQNGGGYCNSGDALLARGVELTKLISNQEDAKNLFKKGIWLSTQITETRTKELRDYLLKEHHVIEVTYPAFCRSITKDFLERKSDKWLVKFYSESGSRRERDVWQILKSKPIIRTDNDKMLVPFENGKPTVYMPSPSNPKGKTVKSSLLINKTAKKFIYDLGIRDINVADELRINILSKFKKYEELERKLKYFDIFFQYYKSAKDEATKVDIINTLKDEEIILFEDASDDPLYWGKASNGYIKTPELEVLYDDDQVWFVSKRLPCKDKDRELLTEFLLALGVDNSLARVQNMELSYEYRKELRSGGKCTNEIVENYDIHELDYILDNITPERSNALLTLLAEQSLDFFEGKYSWSYSFDSKTKKFPAHFVGVLNQSAWLVGNDGSFKRPDEIVRHEAIESYGIAPSAPLLQVLSFIPDAIDSLPEQFKQRLELVRDIPIEILQKLKEEHEKAQTIHYEEQVIEEEAGLTATTIIEMHPSVLDADEAPLSTFEQEPLNTTEQKEPRLPLSNTIRKEVVIRTTDNKRKTIGGWAEEAVIHSLLMYYKKGGYTTERTISGFTALKGNEKIILINRNSDDKIQHGYDFELWINDCIIEYIEVKGKVSEELEMFPISGSQWEKAKALNIAGKGNAYAIYVVSSVGKADFQIHKFCDPYGLWIQGRLYADPVNIQF